MMKELNQTTNQLIELNQVLGRTDLKGDCTGLKIETTNSMRNLLDALGDDVDRLEGWVEAILPDQYLEWLYSVPSNSALFEYRRQQSQQGEEDLPR